MKAATIEMEPEIAREKLNAYREALAGRHSQAVEHEYTAAIRGFEELTKGTPLVDPFMAIREAGWREDGRPVLAMARADQRQVEWRFNHSARWVWNDEHKTGRFVGSFAPMVWQYRAFTDRATSYRVSAGSRVLRVDQITVEPPVPPKSGLAMIPMVPADVLPSRGCNLSKHYILWEVEDWNLAPPVDPMLLKPIAGNLFAVIAQWDLSELERAIIAGTRK